MTIDLSRAERAPKAFSADELLALLVSEDAVLWDEVFAAAREMKARCGKTEVLARGLVECSNRCRKNCLYCGIRRDHVQMPRYQMTEDEVRGCLDEARRRGYPAVAFQAGEIESEENTAYYERLLANCRGLEVTLSLGEQTEAVYRRWKEAGALRYLIRIETSNRGLYGRIHPADCSFDRRVSCIRTLKRLGYVTGTGVMIGFPGQTAEDLVRDLVFFGEESVDMVGMGPYIPHADTPMGKLTGTQSAAARLALAYRMIALTRLYLRDVNIVAATALEVLDPTSGRKRGLDAGANVIMPNLTPDRYRHAYDLYPGKAESRAAHTLATGDVV